MNTITTILKFGNNKNCFLILVDRQSGPAKIDRTDGVIVYEVAQGFDQKAYFSVHGNSVKLRSGDTVQLNGWYANKLGFRDGDPLVLEKIRSTVPTARRVQVEPAAPDDWEILEHNTGRVETVLLDQVRVVWPGQIFPIWIQRSICVYMKIFIVDPMASCVVLENNTEIVVAPKLRVFSPPSTLMLPQTQGTTSVQQENQTIAPKQFSKSMQCMTSAASPSKAKAEEFVASSDYDSSDTLEPRPVQRSPSRSPRLSKKNIPVPKQRKILSNTDPLNNRSDNTTRLYIVQRQSSLMNSVMKYLLPFMHDTKNPDDGDSRSDSDAGSAIDYSMQNLPPRSGVLRVQPLRLGCTLEECFAIPKFHLNQELLSKKVYPFRTSRQAFESKVDETKSYDFPCELFQPSTVYVDYDCTKNERLLHPYLPYLPNNFIARLQRIPSPQEKAEAMQKSNKKGGKDMGKEASGATNQVSQPETPSDQNTTNESTVNKDYDSISGSCFVRVVVINRKAGLTDSAWQEGADRVLSEQPLLFGHVMIHDLLRRQMKLQATSLVWLQTGPIDLVIPRKVCIYPLSQLSKHMTNDILIAAFRHHIKQCANDNHPMVIFQGLFLKFVVYPGNTVEVQLTFYGENDLSSAKAVTMLSEMNIDSVLVVIERDKKDEKLGVVNTILSYVQTADFDPPLFPVKLKRLGGVEEITKQAVIHLHASLGARPLSRYSFQARAGLSHGILLVVGPKGCGKTTFVKGLCRKVGHSPIMAYITMIDCKTLRGKAVSQIQKILEAVFDEAAWREPSMIVFDNLDVIVPAASGPETDITGESLYSAKNAQVLQSLIKYEIQNNSRVAVLATCQSRSSLHASLITSRGLHIIQHIVQIRAPDQEVREKILMSILENHSSVSTETVKTLDLRPLAARSEGYVARDLECLVNRAIHNKLVCDREAYKEKITLTSDDFENALSDYKPASIRNVPLHKAGDLGWDDVGGLTSVKIALTETLRWPIKYPQLFSSCSLRLRSGILLYGPPGTGKTLLAGVVAKECGLNFISIKGPELLSKYIGASEQAVRDLFARAQSAKPCILFFDEFDSIAPKRGHDSTGVTDRVVNQLLTQLDGVESLKGVYVLGATSRPDLIDPALLRPGRLDKCLYCTIPDENERSAILCSLTRKMHLSYDVDLQEVASICTHFTGADLKALLYNAQLKAIHEQMETDNCLNDSFVRIRGSPSQCLISRKTPESNSNQSSELQQESKTLEEIVVPVAHVDKALPALPVSDLTTNGGESEVLLDLENWNPSTGKSGSTSPSSPHSEENHVGMISQNSENANPDNCFIEDEIDSPLANELHDQHKKFHMNYHDVTYIEETGKSLQSEPINVTFKVNGHYQQKDRKPESCTDAQSWSSLINKTQVQASDFEKGVADTLKMIGDNLPSDQLNFPDSKLPSTVHTDFNIAENNIQQKQSGHSDSLEDQDVTKISTTLTLNTEDRKRDFSTYTFIPQSPKRKRTYARSRKIAQTLVQESGVMSPSMERPVTVFTSLEHGLATLTVEDEARYLTMVQEIQHRDEILFEAANAKRRTSLQLASRPAVLVEVTQRHLMEEAKAMRPSVSAAERAKYFKIYENFVSSRTGDFDRPQEIQAHTGKRATLA